MAPTSKSRSKTPYEGIHGQVPDISHLVPFYSKSYVTVPDQKRSMLKRRGLGTLRAETGRFVGYSYPYGNTSRVILDPYVTETGFIRGNRMVDSISVTLQLTILSASHGRLSQAKMRISPRSSSIKTSRFSSLPRTKRHSSG
jgi:hypothetical protein